MEQLFYLYSLKANGWLTDGGAYVDDIGRAKAFDGMQAHDRVRAHYDKHSGQFMLILIPSYILSIRP